MATQPDSAAVGGADSTASAARVLRLRVRAVTNSLRESLLFLPIVMLAGTGIAELVLNALDHRFPSASDLPYVITLSPDAAVSLLTTIAGAVITTAGVVFSLMVVSLQLASGQFSPRVLRGFYRDRLGQVLVGLLMSTFLYCVVMLSRLDTSAKTSPAWGMIGAFTLTLMSIVAIVAYLDRISRRQYVGSILERITAETIHLVEELPTGVELLGVPIQSPEVNELGTSYVVTSVRDGWVQQMSARLVLGAVPAGSVVRLELRIGAYVVAGGPLVAIWPPPADRSAVDRAVRDAVIIGGARTMQEDIDFGLRQLNDIALRALSPAVNDPTTAVEVTLRLASVMRRLLLADLPPQSVRDSRDRVLITPWDLDHGEYVRHAFDQLRHVAAPQLAVAQAIIRALRMLSEACEDAGRTEVLPELRRQIELTLAGVDRAGLLPADVQAARAVDRPQSPAHVRASLGDRARPGNPEPPHPEPPHPEPPQNPGPSAVGPDAGGAAVAGAP
jgi:uncharacterized membrane protein